MSQNGECRDNVWTCIASGQHGARQAGVSVFGGALEFGKRWIFRGQGRHLIHLISFSISSDSMFIEILTCLSVFLLKKKMLCCIHLFLHLFLNEDITNPRATSSFHFASCLSPFVPYIFISPYPPTSASNFAFCKFSTS